MTSILIYCGLTCERINKIQWESYISSETQSIASALNQGCISRPITWGYSSQFMERKFILEVYKWTFECIGEANCLRVEWGCLINKELGGCSKTNTFYRHFWGQVALKRNSLLLDCFWPTPVLLNTAKGSFHRLYRNVLTDVIHIRAELAI